MYGVFKMNNYQSYKNRTIDFIKEVKIYKNLHNGLFSVMQNGLVVAHIESFKMSNPSFKVNEKARLKVIKEGKKNVHAFIIGTLDNVNCINADKDFYLQCLYKRLSYNPYNYNCFYKKVDGGRLFLLDNLCVYPEFIHAHSSVGMTYIN